MEPNIAKFESLYKCYKIPICKNKHCTIFKVRLKSTNHKYCAKIYKIAENDRAMKEINILFQCKGHPNIIEIIEYFKTTNRVIIILEYAKYQDLYKRKDKLQYSKEVITQICNGLEYIHSKGLVHSDIKPENILVYSKSPLQIKICDFERSAQRNTRNSAGTVEYISPEIIAEQNVDTYSDVWSLGCVIHYLQTKIDCFIGKNSHETMKNISTNNYKLHDSVCDKLRDLLTKIFQREPHDRPTIQEILNHEFLKSN